MGIIRKASRATLLGFVAVGMAVSLAACGSTPTPAADKTTPAANAGASSAAAGPSGELVYFDLSGGTAIEALSKGIFANFTKETGVPVKPDFGQQQAKLRAAVEAKQVPWSLAQVGFLPTQDKSVLLEKLDPSIVPLDLLQEGSYDEYTIEYGAFGLALTYSLHDFPNGGPQPSKMSDLFDTAKFPGKRCFMEDIRVGWVLEAAVQADGVAGKDIYPIDLDRAFNKLATIKDQTVWASSPAVLVQNFENGSCAMGIMSTGAALGMIEQDGFEAAINWNQGGYASSAWGIPLGAPNPEAAQYLLKAILTDTAGQNLYTEAVASPIPTGLKNFDYSSIKDQSVLHYLPYSDNIKDCTKRGSAWWLEHRDEITDRFNRFVAS
ncbi:MAG: extracellular solute-binding protein [Propionibacteriaceae bacterium]|jgi:putative spermidine/putrescine transport system substrate-binding protein|nr:extracellular solute-binding protein [Propionibacteriaceae bacterium]